MVATDITEVSAIEDESPSPWSAGSLAEELTIPQAIQFVAESSTRRILGWCGCRVIWPEAELLKIAVTKESRRCGVGRFLLQHVLGELQKRKVTSLFLEVRSNNYTAVLFYEKQGFIQVGTRPGYYSEPPDSAILLKKDLL